MALQDPSFGVQQLLLPHLHLVSTNRYPILASLPIEQAFEFLIRAPHVVKEVAPMTWTYLQGPSDGTVFLEWQPASQRQSRFASDGYVWADAESAFTMDVRGYTLEILVHRSGYRPGFEQIATHARHRYRIVAKNPAATGPAPAFDPLLWIVHYSQTEPQNRFPVNRIPVQADVHRMVQERRWLESQGQLTRKEFMLHDRYNWPTVNIPGHGQTMAHGNFAPGPGGAAAGTVPAGIMGRPGQFYPSSQTPQVGPSPAKRQRQAMNQTMAGNAGGPVAVPVANVSYSPESLIEEEENTALGDLLDNLTQEEISKVRYVQHHLWMEEVLASPYATGSIAPVDLGLGLVGELGRLTDGLLTPASSKLDEVARPGAPPPSTTNQYRHLDKDQMEEFEKRVGNFLKEGEKDMQRMKAAHARRMAGLGRAKAYAVAERRLSKAMGSKDLDEAARPTSEGASDGGDSDRAGLLRMDPQADKVAAEVVEEIQQSMGIVIKPRKDITCIDKGGFIDDKEEAESGDAAAAVATAQQNDSAMQDVLHGDFTATDFSNANGNVPTSGGAVGGMDFFAPGSAKSTPAAQQMSDPASQRNSVSSGAMPAAQGNATQSVSAQVRNNSNAGVGGTDAVAPATSIGGAGEDSLMQDVGLDLDIDIPDVGGIPVDSAVAATGAASKSTEDEWVMVGSANAEGNAGSTEQKQRKESDVPSTEAVPSLGNPPDSELKADARAAVAGSAATQATTQADRPAATAAAITTPNSQQQPPNANPPPATGQDVTAITATISSTIPNPDVSSTTTDHLSTNPAPATDTASVPAQAPATSAADITTTTTSATEATNTLPATTTTSTTNDFLNFDGIGSADGVDGLVDFQAAAGGDLDLGLDESAFGEAFGAGMGVGGVGEIAEGEAGGNSAGVVGGAGMQGGGDGDAAVQAGAGQAQEQGQATEGAGPGADATGTGKETAGAGA